MPQIGFLLLIWTPIHLLCIFLSYEKISKFNRINIANQSKLNQSILEGLLNILMIGTEAITLSGFYWQLVFAISQVIAGAAGVIQEAYLENDIWKYKVYFSNNMLITNMS